MPFPAYSLGNLYGMKYCTGLGWLLLISWLFYFGCKQPETEEVFTIHFPDSPYLAGMRVDGIRQPDQGFIEDTFPRFTWYVPSEAGYQTAYRLWVASNESDLLYHHGSVWDSGKINRSASILVPYEGPALAPDHNYYWQVQLWDASGQATDYSPIQRFTTGQLTGISRENLQVKLIPPARLEAIDVDHYLVDFGKVAFGTLALYYPVEESDSLTIRLGEKLNEKGRIDRDPPGSVRYQEISLQVGKPKSNFILDLPPDARNTGPNAIRIPDSIGVVMPFRYAEIENGRIPITPGMVRQRAVFYDFDPGNSSFESSDTLLDNIWNLCKYSIQATSFAGIYVDGDRERIPYEADAYINQLSHYQVDGEYSLARKTIVYLMEHPTWPTEWQLHMAMMIYQDYYYTGDAQLIHKYYEALKKKCLVDLALPNGLITTKSPALTGAFMAALGFRDTTQRLQDIVDWPPAQKDTDWPLANAKGERDGYEMVPVNTVVNAFYYRNLIIMEEFARLLGKMEEAEQWHDRAYQVRTTFNTLLFDPVRGIYVDGLHSHHASLHSNMLPLAFGLVPENHQSTVVNFLESRGMACSVYGAQYLLEALYQAGDAQYALEVLRSRNDRSWWNMLQNGSTITWEAWDMKYKPNADWNHAWGTAPANIIARHLWGIRPQSPGFDTIRIEPQPGDLMESQIKIPTLHGPIQASFARQGTGKTYVLSLPANTNGWFIVREPVESALLDGVSVPVDSIRFSGRVHKIDLNY